MPRHADETSHLRIVPCRSLIGDPWFGHVFSIGSVNPLTKPTRRNVTSRPRAVQQGGTSWLKRTPNGRSPTFPDSSDFRDRSCALSCAPACRSDPTGCLRVEGAKGGEPRTQASPSSSSRAADTSSERSATSTGAATSGRSPDAEIQPRPPSRAGPRGRARSTTRRRASSAISWCPVCPEMGLFDRVVTSILIRSVASDIVTDPAQAALRRPVFELRPRGRLDNLTLYELPCRRYLTVYGRNEAAGMHVNASGRPDRIRRSNTGS